MQHPPDDVHRMRPSCSTLTARGGSHRCRLIGRRSPGVLAVSVQQEQTAASAVIRQVFVPMASRRVGGAGATHEPVAGKNDRHRLGDPVVEPELRLAVAAARAPGYPWAMIDVALDTTPQDGQRRFDRKGSCLRVAAQRGTADPPISVSRRKSVEVEDRELLPTA